MRELKFRVWDSKKKCWTDIFLDRLFITDGSTIELGNAFFRARLKIEQYTGLKDKNGKEIYEGDIFRNAINGGTWRISWNGNDSAFWVDSRVSGCSLGEFNWDRSNREYGFIEKNCEVVGNIHENPELLECK